jgi:hypothetical protein
MMPSRPTSLQRPTGTNDGAVVRGEPFPELPPLGVVSLAPADPPSLGLLLLPQAATHATLANRALPQYLELEAPVLIVHSMLGQRP